MSASSERETARQDAMAKQDGPQSNGLNILPPGLAFFANAEYEKFEHLNDGRTLARLNEKDEKERQARAAYEKVMAGRERAATHRPVNAADDYSSPQPYSRGGKYEQTEKEGKSSHTRQKRRRTRYVILVMDVTDK
jgi:hypothetical protein